MALVEHLSDQALERGALRLFVRLPERDPLLPAFRLRGFRQYATEVVVYADKPGPRSEQFPDGVRPVKRGGNRMLYQLDRKGAARASEKQEYVVDRIEVAGWVKVERSTGVRPDTLQFMVLPEGPLPGELAD